MGVLATVLQAVFPASCAGCGAPAEGLCPECSSGAQAPRDLLPPPGIDWIAAPFVYEGALREVVARLKYRDRRIALTWLADAVADRVCVTLQEASGCAPPEVITWPPTTRARRAQRGFDQAELLARAVAARLGVPARPMLLRCSGSEQPQTGRSRAERRRAFPSFNVLPSFARQGLLHCCSVLVVDDVVTSGSTLQSAARTLRAFGVTTIGAGVIAATPLKMSRFASDNTESEQGVVQRSEHERKVISTALPIGI